MPSPPLPNPSVFIEVIHLDDSIVAVSKARGVASEPGPGHRTTALLNGLFARFGKSLEPLGEKRDWGMLHRLDRDTSGVMVVALTAKAYDHLRAQFAGRQLEKRYLTVVRGRLTKTQGTCTLPLERVRRGDALISTVSPKGQPAVTHWRALARADDLTLLDVRIETGRTHQIRVHLAHLGTAVDGDLVYRPLLPANTSGFKKPSPLRLHAWNLAGIHPNGGPFSFTAPLPMTFLDSLPQSLRQAIPSIPGSPHHETECKAEGSSVHTPAGGESGDCIDGTVYCGDDRAVELAIGVSMGQHSHGVHCHGNARPSRDDRRTSSFVSRTQRFLGYKFNRPVFARIRHGKRELLSPGANDADDPFYRRRLASVWRK
ncbi:MAG: RluA family pseudouridine synthase [Planctomycetota bacterium]|nr:RluA family pseudouridine synthase [Planctomycetota bacterium]